MIARVAVPYRVPRVFDYVIDEEDAKVLSSGSLVQVPFRNRSTHGFVLGLSEHSDVEPSKLKKIDSILASEPLFDKQMLEFLEWVSKYYCHPLGETIATAVPKDSWRQTRKKTTEQIQTLAQASEKPKLTNAQQAAFEQIISADPDTPVLLFGVTGSGKTEIYMQVIERLLEEDQGAIVLAPEISLTPQLLNRFSDRFPGKTAVLHSNLTPRERHREWQRVASGKAKIVVGARSAIFAPVKNLSLIVVDEEQEPSFKQEDSLRYHARDMAVVRAKLLGARIILGSATPSLESFHNAQLGKYKLVRLAERVLDRPLPKPQFVDLKDTSQLVHHQMPWLSRVLAEKIQQKIDQKEQVLLYLNRLGYSHFLFCQDCGHTQQCSDCDISLTYYKDPPKLKCHYCGRVSRPPQSCEGCGGTQIMPIGVGTQQVEESLKQMFPSARITRMDRSVVRTRKDLEGVLEKISNRETDIVIGTQMIAKGHDFPGISLVGILLADASLNIPDFRANERTFQVVTQVSGRAGRAETAGEVVIQTLNPEHWVLQAAAKNQSDEFYKEEALLRQTSGFPPSTRLALLRFQYGNRDRVKQLACQTVDYLAQLPENNRCAFVGPAEAPLAKIKKLYRWQCLVKSGSIQNLRNVLLRAQAYIDSKRTPVQFAVDVDPITLW